MHTTYRIGLVLGALACATTANTIDTISLKNLETKEIQLVKELQGLQAQVVTASQKGQKLGNAHQIDVLKKMEELQKVREQKASITGQPILAKPMTLKKGKK